MRIEPLAQPVRLVAGADVAYSRRSHRMYAAVVLVQLPSLELVELAEWYGRATFPYIPGLLTFREIPPLLEAFRRLRMQPDAILFDGQGLAHPRRFGLACHGGLLFDRPSVGCAKSRLVGSTARSVSSVARRRCSRTRGQGWGRCSGRGVGSDRSTCRQGTLSIGRRRSSSCSRAPVAFAFQSRSGSPITRRRRCGALTTPTRYRWRCGTIRGFVRKTHSED